ncbi:Protein of unknown function [Propionibacterium freudenreichii]|nr:Protein of unknown function [Propionibacterium freudenreichii]
MILLRQDMVQMRAAEMHQIFQPTEHLDQGRA